MRWGHQCAAHYNFHCPSILTMATWMQNPFELDFRQPGGHVVSVCSFLFCRVRRRAVFHQGYGVLVYPRRGTGNVHTHLSVLLEEMRRANSGVEEGMEEL